MTEGFWFNVSLAYLVVIGFLARLLWKALKDLFDAKDDLEASRRDASLASDLQSRDLSRFRKRETVTGTFIDSVNTTSRGLKKLKEDLTTLDLELRSYVTTVNTEIRKTL